MQKYVLLKSFAIQLFTIVIRSRVVDFTAIGIQKMCRFVCLGVRKQ